MQLAFPHSNASLGMLGFPGLPDKESGGPRQNVSLSTPQSSRGMVAAALRVVEALVAHARRGLWGGALCGCV